MLHSLNLKVSPLNYCFIVTAPITFFNTLHYLNYLNSDVPQKLNYIFISVSLIHTIPLFVFFYKPNLPETLRSLPIKATRYFLDDLKIFNSMLAFFATVPVLSLFFHPTHWDLRDTTTMILIPLLIWITRLNHWRTCRHLHPINFGICIGFLATSLYYNFKIPLVLSLLIILYAIFATYDTYHLLAKNQDLLGATPIQKHQGVIDYSIMDYLTKPLFSLAVTLRHPLRKKKSIYFFSFFAAAPFVCLAQVSAYSVSSGHYENLISYTLLIFYLNATSINKKVGLESLPIPAKNFSRLPQLFSIIIALGLSLYIATAPKYFEPSLKTWKDRRQVPPRATQHLVAPQSFALYPHHSEPYQTQAFGMVSIPVHRLLFLPQDQKPTMVMDQQTVPLEGLPIAFGLVAYHPFPIKETLPWEQNIKHAQMILKSELNLSISRADIEKNLISLGTRTEALAHFIYEQSENRPIALPPIWLRIATIFTLSLLLILGATTAAVFLKHFTGTTAAVIHGTFITIFIFGWFTFDLVGGSRTYFVYLGLLLQTFKTYPLALLAAFSVLIFFIFKSGDWARRPHVG